MQLTEEEWKAKLTPEQYNVLREKGTEPPFTGNFLHNKDKGTYICAGCGQPLFDSGHKFDSGSGWPSFYDVTMSDAVEFHRDMSTGTERTEVTCKNCGGHLGHVFDDAYDQPGGRRYCINGCSLDFKKGQ